MASRVTPKIPDKLFFKIGEVSKLLGIKAYVLRYWETEFPMIAPRKSPKNQRVYRRSEVEAFFVVKHLLYEEKYSIAGARRRLKSSLGKERPPTGQKDQLLGLVTDLESLARAPISRLFHF